MFMGILTTHVRVYYILLQYKVCIFNTLCSGYVEVRINFNILYEYLSYLLQ